MRSSSPPVIERARPLLGTIVSIRAQGGVAGSVDAAFAEIELIHHLMSFHRGDSDISRLNREAHLHPVPVHRHTRVVLRQSQILSAASDGIFDVTVAPLLVEWGLLPRPEKAPSPDPAADWRDMTIQMDGLVRFARPLWVDFGGIAKGYAVDCAMAILAAHGVVQCSINAGGDIAIFGPAAELVGLRTDLCLPDALPTIQLRDAAIASSGGAASRRRVGGRWRGPHVHPERRMAAGLSAFACVVAERCVLADALTKLVLVQGRASEAVLRRFGAEAHLFDRRWGWRAIGITP